jgi:hypothetical protein
LLSRPAQAQSETLSLSLKAEKLNLLPGSWRVAPALDLRPDRSQSGCVP